MQEKVWLRRKSDGELFHVIRQTAVEMQYSTGNGFDEIADPAAKPVKKRAAKKSPKKVSPKPAEPESADVELDDLLAGLESGEDDK